MLKKVIKHEMIATWRIFLPIYIGLVILTAISCGFAFIANRVDTEVATAILGMGTVLLILTLMFVLLSPYIVLAVRFYKSTATREAYLTFTLPANTNTILFAKFLVGFLWLTITFILWYLSFGLIVCGFTEEEFVATFIKDIFASQGVPMILLQLGTIVIGLASSVLMVFASISLSQLVRDHRVLASIAFYFGLYTVQQIISTIILIPVMIGEIGSSIVEEPVSIAAIEPSVDSALMGTYLIALLVSALFGVACYFISKYLLSKKLNLL